MYRNINSHTYNHTCVILECKQVLFFVYAAWPHCVTRVGRTLWLGQEPTCIEDLHSGGKSNDRWLSHAGAVSVGWELKHWGYGRKCKWWKDHTENETEWNIISAAWMTLMVDDDEKKKSLGIRTERAWAGLGGHTIMLKSRIPILGIRCLTSLLYFTFQCWVSWRLTRTSCWMFDSHSSQYSISITVNWQASW